MRNPGLDKLVFRKFGLTMAILIGPLFGLFLPWLFERSYPIWPWIFAGTFALWAIFLPMSLIIIYKPWMKISYIIGTFNSKVLLSLVFYVIFTPVSLILRISGKDFMCRSLDNTVDTYWKKSIKQEKDHMERGY